MNWDTVEGNWKQWQGAVKKQWAKLTDDELAQIDGDRIRLAGILQERYGRKKDEIERDIDEFTKSLR
jgi:uncharacterized protein YjbJ (UPF0337 family)